MGRWSLLFMAEFSTKLSLLGRLRSCPIIYSILRKGVRFLAALMIETTRKMGLGIRFGGPLGFYSGLAELKKGNLAGRAVLGSQALPTLPVPSLIELAGMGQNGRQPWPIFWVQQRNRRLVGSSLAPMDSNKNLMIEAVYGEEFCRTDPSYNYLRLPPPVRLSGSWTSLISLWSEGYYHWFTDVLPRLALLSEFPSETKILMRGPLMRYQQESLFMLGVLDRVRETPEGHLLIDEYYFSSPPSMTGCTDPYSVNWLRDQFLPCKADVETPNRFFIIRKGKTRGIKNQSEVAKLFKSRGWVVVDLEELSLAEQITWFSNAEAIAGEHGAGFTNLLWCSPGCRVLELCPDNFLNGCYEGISICNQLKHSFLVFQANTKNEITIPLSVLEEHLHGI